MHCDLWGEVVPLGRRYLFVMLDHVHQDFHYYSGLDTQSPYLIADPIPEQSRYFSRTSITVIVLVTIATALWKKKENVSVSKL